MYLIINSKSDVRLRIRLSCSINPPHTKVCAARTLTVGSVQIISVHCLSAAYYSRVITSFLHMSAEAVTRLISSQSQYVCCITASLPATHSSPSFKTAELKYDWIPWESEINCSRSDPRGPNIHTWGGKTVSSRQRRSQTGRGSMFTSDSKKNPGNTKKAKTRHQNQRGANTGQRRSWTRWTSQ